MTLYDRIQQLSTKPDDLNDLLNVMADMARTITKLEGQVERLQNQVAGLHSRESL